MALKWKKKQKREAVVVECGEVGEVVVVVDLIM
jgi:hypothetical protein